jgi:hypothetical protein
VIAQCSRPPDCGLFLREADSNSSGDPQLTKAVALGLPVVMSETDRCDFGAWQSKRHHIGHPSSETSSRAHYFQSQQPEPASQSLAQTARRHFPELDLIVPIPEFVLEVGCGRNRPGHLRADKLAEALPIAAREPRSELHPGEDNSHEHSNANHPMSFTAGLTLDKSNAFFRGPETSRNQSVPNIVQGERAQYSATAASRTTAR